MKQIRTKVNSFSDFSFSSFKKFLILVFFIFSHSTIAEAMNKADVEEDQNKIEKSSIKTQKNIKKGSKKVSKKTASKKQKKPLSLEEVSKSTAFIISGTDDNAGAGSGFFIAKSLLVTNNHVIKDAIVKNGFRIVFIETQQGIKDLGFVFARDEENDLAIIKTFKKIHKPLKLGQYNKVKMGDEIFVLGSPQGLVGTFVKRDSICKKKMG